MMQEISQLREYEYKEGLHKRYVVGITGASGAILGYRLVQELLARCCRVDLVVTKAGSQVLKSELNMSGFEAADGLFIHDIDDIAAPIASGSVKTDGMVVAPCSMGTLASISNGLSANLLQRAADVAIKEGRKLILIPRETPFSSIHLKNMLTLSQVGVVMIPPIPAFYMHPETMDDVVNYIVGKVLDQLGISHQLYRSYV